MSNVDFVDWGRAQKMQAAIAEEADDYSSAPSTPQVELLLPKPATPVVEVHAPSPVSSAPSTPRPPTPRPETPPTPPVSPPVKRTMPVPKKYTAQEENEDYELRAEKEALLQDLQNLERTSGVKLTRNWSVDLHTMDELQFEYDRIQSELNANQMVETAKTGIKFGIGGIEMFLKSSGFQAVDGWSNNSCKDMSKYNRPLLKLYKRYWRKTSMSPMMELAFLLFGGLAWTVAENKMGLGGRKPPPAPAAAAPPPTNAQWEPPPRPMRPPSMNGVSGPRWSEAPKPATPTPPAPDANAELMKLIQEQQRMIQEQKEAMAKRDEQAEAMAKSMMSQMAAMRAEIRTPRSRSSRSTVSSSSSEPRRVTLGGGRNTNRSTRRKTPNVMSL